MSTEDELNEFGKKIEDASKVNFAKALDNAVEGARRLNEVFGQTNERVTELTQSISDTIPGITALGGSITNVFETLEQVSQATRRNIVASSEDAAKLFAAQKILGGDVQSIVEKFEQVGVQFSQIGKQLQTSINYVQNLGLNVKQIMGDVSANMKTLNEFNFAGGVEGLTKMAAHASLFKFDMNQTFKLAEEALSPDGAIKLASAFQRMGVAVGELTDPFQLMNMSLNDPEGLQKSLANIGKQYTEFDEKTKTFKISPSGILQMKELAAQTNMSYQNLAQSALAGANLDKALSQIKPGITFSKPEDRDLLASLSTMGEEGDYEVNIKNELGDDIPTKLSNLTQPQIDKLLEEQKKSPKTLEDIAKAQLTVSQGALSELKSIASKATGSVVSTRQVRGVTADLSEFTRMVGSTINAAVPTTKELRPEVEKGISNITTLLAELSKGNLTGDKAKSSIKSIEDQIEALSKNASGITVETIEKIRKKGEEIITNAKSGYLSTNTVSPENKKVDETSVKESKIDLGGTITFKVDAPPGVSKDELERYINSTEFKQKIYQYIRDIDVEKEKTKRNTP